MINLAKDLEMVDEKDFRRIFEFNNNYYVDDPEKLKKLAIDSGITMS
jgi:hypothetical protein